LFPAPQTNKNIPTREVTMNPASIAFLKEQNVDFREWILNGVPYTTLDNATEYVEQFHAKYEKEREKEDDDIDDNDSSRHDMDGGNNVETSPPPLEDPYEPREAPEIAYVARSMANLREWIDSAATPMRNISSLDITLDEEEGAGIVKILPNHKNTTIRNYLIRKIKQEYPFLHWYKHKSHDYVLRLSEDEKQIRDERIKRVEWQNMMLENIGFARVFKALSDASRGELGHVKNLSDEYRHFLERSERGVISLTSSAKNRRSVPIVVHNGLMDLLFLMTHFHSDNLPSEFSDTKELIRRYFPNIYDTKVIATEYMDYRFRNKSSSLDELYQRHVMGIQGINDHNPNEVLMRLVYPRVEILNGVSNSISRDVGDDAFMIGAVFQCLCRTIMNQDLVGFDFGVMNESRVVRSLYPDIVSSGVKGVGSLLFLDDKYDHKRDARQLIGINMVSNW